MRGSSHSYATRSLGCTQPLASSAAVAQSGPPHPPVQPLALSACIPLPRCVCACPVCAGLTGPIGVDGGRRGSTRLHWLRCAAGRCCAISGTTGGGSGRMTACMCNNTTTTIRQPAIVHLYGTARATLTGRGMVMRDRHAHSQSAAVSHCERATVAATRTLVQRRDQNERSVIVLTGHNRCWLVGVSAPCREPLPRAHRAALRPLRSDSIRLTDRPLSVCLSQRHSPPIAADTSAASLAASSQQQRWQTRRRHRQHRPLLQRSRLRLPAARAQPRRRRPRCSCRTVSVSPHRT